MRYDHGMAPPPPPPPRPPDAPPDGRPAAESSVGETADACELCGRSGLELTRHHLIPRARHNKPRTRRHHDRDTMKSAIAWLCRPCHKTVHHHLSEQELAEVFHTVDALRGHPEIAKFARWVAKQPPGKSIRSRRPARRR